MKNLKAYFAEALGTFVLVFFACGVAAYTGGSVVATSLAFGLVIVAMAYSVGRISGCHINPAVSLGCLLDNRMSLKDFFGYVIAQFVGGIAGGLALFGIAKMSGATLLGNACNGLVGSGDGFLNTLAAFLMEIVLTCVFVYVILNVTDAKNEGAGKKAGLIIGLTLTLVHLLGIGFTGTSVNPARSFATAFADLVYNGSAASLAVVWVFILAPLFGGALAALLFRAFHKSK
jgi:aquaporin Z